MNRILFLPLNRPLAYFARRALFKGHMVYFKLNPGNVRLGWRSENFVDHRELGKYQPAMGEKRDWVHYLLARKIDYVITNVEDNKEIIKCLEAAKSVGIKTVYIMHGGGKIYDYDFQKDWYTSGIYDYFYAKDEYTKKYIQEAASIWKFDRVKARKFTRKFPTARYFHRKPERILFVPSQAHPDWYLEGSGVLMNNDEKAEYQGWFLDAMKGIPGVEFLCCHDEKRDAAPNKLVKRLMDLKGNMKWVDGRPEKYFRKVDACMTDVGSSFFFNAIRAGKPILCLHHYRRVKFKPETASSFWDCIKVFHTRGAVEFEIDKFANSYMFDYIPRAYLRDELKPNDPLVWEEP